MTVYAYTFVCDKCSDVKTIFTDFKDFLKEVKRPQPIACQIKPCGGTMRMGKPPEGFESQAEDPSCDDCGTKEAPGWFKDKGSRICPGCMLKRHPDRALKESVVGEDQKVEEAGQT